MPVGQRHRCELQDRRRGCWLRASWMRPPRRPGTDELSCRRMSQPPHASSPGPPRRLVTGSAPADENSSLPSRSCRQRHACAGIADRGEHDNSGLLERGPQPACHGPRAPDSAAAHLLSKGLEMPVPPARKRGVVRTQVARRGSLAARTGAATKEVCAAMHRATTRHVLSTLEQSTDLTPEWPC